jgi:ATP-binding cassette subfamily D (ALD) long-chain fatty acid import protein
VKLYATNRPVIQRFLTAGFVIFILTSSYRGISGKTSHPSQRQKGKEKEKGKGKEISKPQRVAVCLPSSAGDFLRI